MADAPDSRARALRSPGGARWTRRRARPVADAPVRALAARGEELAKAWLLEIVAAAPLSEAASLPGEGFAGHAPRLCVAVVRALVSDEALAELEPGGAMATLAGACGRLAGASDVPRTLGCIEALESVLWTALRSAVPDAPANQVFDLAARLATVMGVVREATLTAPGPSTRVNDLLSAALAAAASVSVVSVQIDDLRRLEQSVADSSDVTRRVLQAASGTLRPGEHLVREPDGCAWVVLADATREHALALAERIEDAVGALAPVRGAPLRVNLGVATSPEDGSDPDALLAAADEAAFAAAARGRLTP